MGNDRSAVSLLESPSPWSPFSVASCPAGMWAQSDSTPPMFMGFLVLCSSLSTSVLLSHKNPNAVRHETGPLCFCASWDPQLWPGLFVVGIQ